MNIAFGIAGLFPGGGLQRDCLALARKVRERGHDVRIFAARASGGIEADRNVQLLPNRAWTNHGGDAQFAAAFEQACGGRFDRVVGFGKLPGLDILYCADPSVAARRTRPLRRWLPRYRTQLALEESCFARGRSTRLLLLSQVQAEGYRQAWDTEPHRMTVLPPNIDVTRRQPHLRTDGAREAERSALGLASGQWVWLAIGVQPKTKGMDRTLRALASFKDAILVIAGVEEESSRSRSIRRRAAWLGVGDRLRVVGFREDIPRLMAAADLLVHPARQETTGTVILEAVVNGLPAVVTAACGYAEHVTKAGAGQVVPEPFDTRQFLTALTQARDATVRAAWSDNAVRYGHNPDLFCGLDRAAAIIAGDR